MSEILCFLWDILKQSITYIVAIAGSVGLFAWLSPNFVKYRIEFSQIAIKGDWGLFLHISSCWPFRLWLTIEQIQYRCNHQTDWISLPNNCLALGTERLPYHWHADKIKPMAISYRQFQLNKKECIPQEVRFKVNFIWVRKIVEQSVKESWEKYLAADR